MDEIKNHSAVKIVGIVVLGIVMVFAILQQAFLPPKNEVSVIGQGRVPVKPDAAIINLSIMTLNAPTAEEALAQTGDKIAKVKSTLTELGIPEGNQQETVYAFNPHFEDNTNTNISGYNGYQQITVRIEGVDKDKQIIDRVIEQATKAGVNQIGQVQFIASNIESIKQQAREKAIADAKTKADTMAKIAGIKIVGMNGWTENILAAPGQIYSEGMGSNSNYFNFPNDNGGFSSSSDNQTNAIVEVTVNYAIK